ncbi:MULTISPECIES: alpha/beta hydrolase [Rhodococcus]|uniref:Alpha/beta hydrolase n=1 Tax=Rhodococcus oxybenzonivorans TaxID=1990687 RepID=A0AAE4UX89_9NOCA|nr:MULTISPECIES: alpha/beta hydrolase [Rhodococcus]MDV7245644.1 alpha/beta hydrolase [Rhodococcus oxybenzonivorans]MDV7264357.1 alpha/beta hydrolase [Rhodococcus oxybenzonivorans]MDV7277001.1 alpha/beta hydrolase [Rhodococcus oxybenzonivorans]MDV7336667.1 alpha/beta hydrolase [Rhodococcus oxybenzonivorans]MDV7346545.1 alpha/beta hydrolase [Rhodococcus oxybenzonivorans]
MPFFDGHSGRVHYRHWPADNPVAQLVFFHGMGQHTGHYHRFARALTSAGIGVWGIDQAGHGLSEGDQPGSVAELAEDGALLTALAEESAPHVPTALMGHSLGAAVSMELLARGNAGFRCAILCGTPKSAAAAQTADMLGLLEMPLLVVHGVDDRIAPIDPIRTWATGIAGLEFREFDDAGHDLLHEKVHPAVTAVVRDFILDAAVRP